MQNFGILGAICNHCNTNEYRNLKILCTNPKVASAYTCEDESLNELWYNEIQKSFYQLYRERNLIWRFRTQNRMKERFMNDINNNPTAYISDSDAFIDLEDAYNRITSLYLGEDEGQDYQLSEDIADLTAK